MALRLFYQNEIAIRSIKSRHFLLVLFDQI
jgi:hypothetical protein